jgi:hypothetical protein
MHNSVGHCAFVWVVEAVNKVKISQESER